MDDLNGIAAKVPTVRGAKGKEGNRTTREVEEKSNSQQRLDSIFRLCVLSFAFWSVSRREFKDTPCWTAPKWARA